jgi:hypothetical protein
MSTLCQEPPTSEQIFTLSQDKEISKAFPSFATSFIDNQVHFKTGEQIPVRIPAKVKEITAPIFPHNMVEEQASLSRLLS